MLPRPRTAQKALQSAPSPAPTDSQSVESVAISAGRARRRHAVGARSTAGRSVAADTPLRRSRRQCEKSRRVQA